MSNSKVDLMMVIMRRLGNEAFLRKNRRVIWVQGPWVGNFKLILCSDGSSSFLDIIGRDS